MAVTVANIQTLAYTKLRSVATPDETLFLSYIDRINQQNYRLLYTLNPQKYMSQSYLRTKTQDIDQSNTTNDSSSKLYTGNNVAQTITVTTDRFKDILFYHNANTGTISTDVTVTAYLWDTDYATTIATTALEVNTYTPEEGDNKIKLSFNTTIGSTYLIVLSTTGGSVANYYNIATDSTSGYTGGSAYVNGIATTDLYFYQYFDNRYLALPTDFGTMDATGCGLFKLNDNQEISINYRQTSYGTYSTGFYIENTKIVVTPETTSSDVLVFRYIPKVDEITATTDTLVIPNEYELYTVYQICALDSIENEESSDTIKLFQEQANAVEQEIRERFAPQKNRIVLGTYNQYHRRRARYGENFKYT